MRTTATALLLACLSGMTAAQATDSRSFVYDGAFVWYLSGRLSAGVFEKLKREGAKLTEGEWAEQEHQLGGVFFHYLIRCDSPLPKLATAVQGVPDPNTRFPDDIESVPAVWEAYGKALDREAWRTIDAWNGSVLLDLMETYRSGTYSLFPDCVHPQFLTQNPVPAK